MRIQYRPDGLWIVSPEGEEAGPYFGPDGAQAFVEWLVSQKPLEVKTAASELKPLPYFDATVVA